MEPFISLIPFDEKFPDTIVVCCSDGRTHLQIVDFLDSRNINADIYAVPGGPLIFAGVVETYQDSSIAQRRIDFLISQHQTTKIILIGHGSDEEAGLCGMAANLFPHLSPAERTIKQKILLAAAKQKIANLTSLHTEAYFANTIDDMIQFEEIE